MSKVTKPIGLTRHTSDLILLYLETIGRPARTSEIRKAITRVSPASGSPIYGALGDLMAIGLVKKISFERDALLVRGQWK